MRSEESKKVQISQSNIDDQVLAYLYATKTLKDSEEVVGIKYSLLENGLVSLELKTKKRAEVKRTDHG